MPLFATAPTFAFEREPAAAPKPSAAPKPRAAAPAAKPNAATTAPAAQQSAKTKPPVPPGVDPGGVAIAIIGPGVDYTGPEIAKRLARDGEGEIIGWDFVDGDRRPFQISKSLCQTKECQAPDIFTRLASEAATVRFEFFRVGHTLGAELEKQIASAIGMATQSPAQIVLLTYWTFPLLNEISRRFPNRFFISAQKLFGGDTQSPARGSNTLVVGGTNDSCSQFDPEIEVAVATDCLELKHTEGTSLFGDGSVAAARIAALAARLKAAEPKITAAEMKQRILSLAKPLPDGPKGPRPYGWIADPMSHFPPK